ncbi:MAG: hypothetical protein ABJL71_02800 [Cyclobacteriaceae bacterium]
MIFSKIKFAPPILALCLMLASCKLGQSSTGQTTRVPKSPTDTTLTPDECLVNAKVLYEAEPGVYVIRIYEVKEVGFGFTQNVNSGDKINVINPLPMEEDATIDIIVQWIEGLEGGYYQVKTGAE